MLTMFIIYSIVFGVHGKYKQGDYSSDYDPIQEVQQAFCTIATKEIEASANATITRQLKGVCTSKELTTKLEKLENKLLNEISEIKTLLMSGPALQNEKQLKHNTDVTMPRNMNKTENPKKNKKRDLEIAKRNGTTEYNGRDKEYLYYWKIDNAQDIFQQENLISNNFFSSGRVYYIKLTPHHLNTKYVAIELKTAGFVRRQHRFIILNQEDSRYDVSSQVLQDHTNFASMYRISGEKFKKFIKYNGLIIKLVLYI